MSDKIIIPKRTNKERAGFFKKTQWRVTALLGEVVDPYLDTTPLEDASIVEEPLESYIEDNEDDVAECNAKEEEE